LIYSVEAYFSPDKRFTVDNSEGCGAISMISFQSGSDIFLPFFFYDAAMRVNEARQPANSECPVGLF